MSALVLGLGESGLAMARWLARDGAPVRVADTRADPPMREALARELPQAAFHAGPLDAALLEGVSLVAISPGLAPDQPPAAGLLAAAAKAGIDVAGEIELFARALQALRAEGGYAPKVLGITGTNGKTTTTRLAARIVEASGLDVEVAGNISPSALDALAARLRDGHLPRVWVLELSSFQLETTRSLACDAAAILNLSEDHLDWHGTMQRYAQAKRRILARGTLAVLNRADPAVMALAPSAAPASSAVRRVTFGPDEPAVQGDFGLVHDRGVDWLAFADEPSDAPPEGRRRRAGDATPPPAAFLRRLMPADALHIHGRHNALNALAALALARAAGCPLGSSLNALRSYRGEPHRTERVGVLGGVEYYDDSKGTNVGATLAAIDGLATAGRRLVVILGGEGKGQRFEPLAPAVAAGARAVVLIGRDGPLIGAALQGAGVPVEEAATLPLAVQRAAALAQPGDAVLLSPACASFDMFRNYEHRADVFRDAVRNLSSSSTSHGAAGAPCQARQGEAGPPPGGTRPCA